MTEWEFNDRNRLVSVSLILNSGSLQKIWIVYRPNDGKYYQCMKVAGEGVTEYPRDRNEVEGFLEEISDYPGHIVSLSVLGSETLAFDEWFRKTGLVFEDLRTLTPMIRESSHSLRGTYVDRRGDTEVSKTSCGSFYGRPQNAVSLTSANTIDCEPDIEKWIKELDVNELVELRSTRFNWRFYPSQCLSNVEIMLRSHNRPSSMQPWVGSVHLPNSIPYPHTWIVDERGDEKSMIDLTLLQPVVFAGAVELARHEVSPFSGVDPLEVIVHSLRETQPLSETRVLGRVPDGWRYVGVPCDEDKISEHFALQVAALRSAAPEGLG